MQGILCFLGLYGLVFCLWRISTGWLKTVFLIGLLPFALLSALMAVALLAVAYFETKELMEKAWLRAKKPVQECTVETVNRGPLIAVCHLSFGDGSQITVELRRWAQKNLYLVRLPKEHSEADHLVFNAHKKFVQRAFEKELDIKII